MKITVTESMFKDKFAAYDRKDNFSWEALGLLFAYLEELEADTGEETELDVVAICCDFTEDSAENVAKSYSIECDDQDDLESVVEDYLNEHTLLIGKTDSGFVYQNF
jgi:hypothetical protein